ncbi:protein tincar-like [Oppia nitens]|uniref:protein tincar-like n=1 Tax=Oppia nitens TaxID=1686743 RepID=UPI0023D9CD4A|nr:protein tincar-like [Oppia nitens]
MDSLSSDSSDGTKQDNSDADVVLQEVVVNTFDIQDDSRSTIVTEISDQSIDNNNLSDEIKTRQVMIASDHNQCSSNQQLIGVSSHHCMTTTTTTSSSSSSNTITSTTNSTTNVSTKKQLMNRKKHHLNHNRKARQQLELRVRVLTKIYESSRRQQQPFDKHSIKVIPIKAIQSENPNPMDKLSAYIESMRSDLDRLIEDNEPQTIIGAFQRSLEILEEELVTQVAAAAADISVETAAAGEGPSEPDDMEQEAAAAAAPALSMSDPDSPAPKSSTDTDRTDTPDLPVTSESGVGDDDSEGPTVD